MSPDHHRPQQSSPEGRPQPPRARTDATGGIIPYRNPPALIAYYLGLFSVVPVLGILLGTAALVLGTKGLINYKQQPAVGGAVHAWVGVLVGGMMFGVNVAIGLFLLILWQA